MTTNNSSLDALIQQKIDADTDFQANLDSLPDEEKDQALADKKAEVSNTIFEEERQSRAKAEEVAKNQKVRAEKAEAEAKKPKENETPKNEEYSLKDIRALSDVPDDLVDKVVGWARFNKIDIAIAKKSPEMQSAIKIYEEERRSAEAANTNPARKGSSKSADALLDKLEGDPSEIHVDDIQAAVRARIAKAQK